jgi:hypothetical protein
MILHFSGRFLLTASLRRRRMSIYISLLTVPITVNHISEFRGLFEATLDGYNHSPAKGKSGKSELDSRHRQKVKPPDLL